MKNAVLQKIESELDVIERREAVKILYACESGSRAWGFESEDSDYDVRFIYIRQTVSYLSIKKSRDVIEKPIDDELDVSGWDIVKALLLLRKSNPPLLEWLQSPIIYREHGAFISRIRQLAPEYYSPKSCMYHYLHMARGNFREYLKGDSVWVKKYFYVLRPVLACIWIESGLGMVPTEFEALVDKVVKRQELREAIDRLLIKKKAGKELDTGERIPVIADFLDAEISRLTAANERPALTEDYEKLDTLFIETLKEINGAGL